MTDEDAAKLLNDQEWERFVELMTGKKSSLVTATPAMHCWDQPRLLVGTSPQAEVSGRFAHLDPTYLLGRFAVALEVAVSKIFCAGAGWQLFSLISVALGFPASSTAFFLLVGVGDALGVLCGHVTYQFCKSFFCAHVDIAHEVVIGIWLGSAAFCSGAVWQIIVTMSSSTYGFLGTLFWTGMVCGFCFFAGLRLGRSLYWLLGMPPATYDNLNSDRLLAISVAAGAALFVGTDASYTNLVVDLLGIRILSSDSAAKGVVRAGMSTFYGFLAMQALQNVVVPRGLCWLDEPSASDAKNHADNSFHGSDSTEGSVEML